eukprot:3508066-Prymnesium_polylepis.2
MREEKHSHAPCPLAPPLPERGADAYVDHKSGWWRRRKPAGARRPLPGLPALWSAQSRRTLRGNRRRQGARQQPH